MDSSYSEEIPDLLTEHLEHLKKSAISLEVIKERGYRSVSGRSQELEHFGFKKNQRKSGILIPVHGVEGHIVYYRLRPDKPRVGENEKPVKYEQPANTSVRFDVPPRCRESLANPKIPLFITEGEKKVDSLVSAGACAIGLPGVWNWKGKNPFGGSTILADFDQVAWNGRLVYIVFDSDAWSNPRIAQAWQRLKGVLGNRSAQVRNLKLPDGPDGHKMGVDDYFVQGHTLQDLIGLEEIKEPSQKISEKSAEYYRVEDGSFCYVKHLTNGGEEAVPLCNFTAGIIENTTKDDGQNKELTFKIAGRLDNGAVMPTIDVTANDFNSLNWINGQWGSEPFLYAIQPSTKDHLRAAIFFASRQAVKKTVYRHLGWREIDGEMNFLFHGGAIGNPKVKTEIDTSLTRYVLPQPEGSPLEAIKASLAFMQIGKREVTMPLWATVFLAPLSEILTPAFTLWLVGPSGSYKSVVSAIALCHFGDFDEYHLPASWRDTANRLETLLFWAKDVPLVIDDWAPGTDSSRAKELEAKAEYIVRDQGNRQGKGRMKSDTSGRSTYYPRGVLITSGEQLPSGQSMTARNFSVEIDKLSINVPLMTEAQAKKSLYPVTMSHYIKWITPQYQTFKKTLLESFNVYRDAAAKSDIHARLPAQVAWLYLGLEMGIAFSQEYGALTNDMAEALRDSGWEIFTRLASEQGARVESERPANRFIEIYKAGIAAGKFRLEEKDAAAPTTPPPGTYSIGWTDGNEFYYLNPIAAYTAIRDYSLHTGIAFTFKDTATWQDLKRCGYTICEKDRPTSTIRIFGETKRVIKLKKSVLVED